MSHHKFLGAFIRELMKKSKRSALEPVCPITVDGHAFSLERMSPDSPDRAMVYELLLKEFSTAEMDPMRFFDACMRGETVNGDKSDIQYVAYIARTSDGRVVSTYIYGLVDLVPGNSARGRLMIGFYAVTTPEYRGYGLNRELYFSALIDAYRTARKDDIPVAAVAGDATERSEHQWNKLGRSRVYYYTEEGSNEYHEVKLLMPWVGVSTESGILTEADFAPEHLMLQGFSAPLSGELVEQVMAAFYRWSEEQVAPAFQNEMQRSSYYSSMHMFLMQSLNPLKGAKGFVFLTADDRKVLKAQGYVFVK